MTGLALELFRPRVRQAEVEQVGEHAHDDALLLAQPGNARRLPVGGFHGEGNHHFVHHLLAEEAREAGEVRDQPVARLLEHAQAQPGDVHKAGNAVTELGPRLDPAGKTQRARVRAHHHHLAQVAAAPAYARQHPAEQRPGSLLPRGCWWPRKTG